MERTIITRRVSRTTSAGCVWADLIPQPQRLHMHSHVFLPPPPADKASRHRSHSDTCWNLGHHVLELLDAQKLISTFSSLSGFHRNRIWDYFFFPGGHCSFFPSFLVKYLLRPEAVWAVIYLFVCFRCALHPLVDGILCSRFCESHNVSKRQHLRGVFLRGPPPQLPHTSPHLISVKPSCPLEDVASNGTHTAPPAEPLTQQTAFCIEDQV